MTRYRYVFAFILVLALVLRLVGINVLSFHPDEGNIIDWVRTMLEKKTLEPQKMSYGTLALYLQAGFLWVVEAVRGLAGATRRLPTHHALVVARMVSVLASVATVAVTAGLARAFAKAAQPPAVTRAIANAEEAAAASSPVSDGQGDLPAELAPSERVEWLAALFFGVAFLSVQCAHYNTVDSVLTLLATGAVLIALRAFESGKPAHFALSGLLAGLAAATKYTGILSSLPLVLIPFITKRRPRPVLPALVGLCCAPLGFFLGMPYALIQPEKLWKAIQFESKHYLTGNITRFAVGPDTLRWNLEFLFYSGVGPGIFLMCFAGILLVVAGVALAGRRSSWTPLPSPDWRRVLLVLIYPVVSVAFLSRYTVRFDRNLLPILPFVALLAAYYAYTVGSSLAPAGKTRLRTVGKTALGLALVLSVAYPLLRDVIFDWQISSQPHTKRQLKAWSRALPKGKTLKTHGFEQQGLAWLQRKGFDYVVMSSHSWEPVAAHPDRYPVLARKYRKLFTTCKPVAVFRNPWFDSDFFAPHHLLNSATVNVYHGPTLIVLEVPHTKKEKQPEPRSGGGSPDEDEGLTPDPEENLP